MSTNRDPITAGSCGQAVPPVSNPRGSWRCVGCSPCKAIAPAARDGRRPDSLSFTQERTIELAGRQPAQASGMDLRFFHQLEVNQLRHSAWTFAFSTSIPDAGQPGPRQHPLIRTRNGEGNDEQAREHGAPPQELAPRRRGRVVPIPDCCARHERPPLRAEIPCLSGGLTLVIPRHSKVLSPKSLATQHNRAASLFWSAELPHFTTREARAHIAPASHERR